MYTNPSYARYRIREKHRRLYVLTKTQMLFGFIVSVFLSIFFGAYFDKYGHLLVTQLKKVAMNAVKDTTPPSAEAAYDSDTPGSSGSAADGGAAPQTASQNLTIEERLQLIERRSQRAGVGASGGQTADDAARTVSARPR